jgi:hypothetical protein
MAGDDHHLFEVARWAFVSGWKTDIDTIQYRQKVFGDCLAQSSAIRGLYALARDTLSAQKKFHIGLFSRHPSGVLYESLEAMGALVVALKKLRAAADAQPADAWTSAGLAALFETLRAELTDASLRDIEQHLTTLQFRSGVLMSAALGRAGEGAGYVLRRPRAQDSGWLDRLLGKGPPSFGFRLDDRDEAGARALAELRDRGINDVANALARSADHILSFFDQLRTELAFYVGCLNLHDALTSIGAVVCEPQPAPSETHCRRFTGLYDVALALTMGGGVVGNTVDTEADLAIVTGANQGGKSTFLRAIGQAQLMMQAGLFVAAETFSAPLSDGVFTHYKREEDETMRHGKLDEELARMSAIVDAIAPGALLLLNESFASTDEREGSEIARQIVSALVERDIRIWFVTHLYDFARRLHQQQRPGVLFLRAAREADGARTFKIVEGEPIETSYGDDLYRAVFGGEEQANAAR